MATVDYIMQGGCFDGEKGQLIHNRSQKHVKKRVNPLSSRPSTPQVLALMGYKKPPVSANRVTFEE